MKSVSHTLLPVRDIYHRFSGSGGGTTLHNLPSEEHSLFSSLEYNIRMGSGLATVQSAREPIVQQDNAQHSINGQQNKKKKKKKKKKVKNGNKPIEGEPENTATTASQLEGDSTTKDSTSQTQTGELSSKSVPIVVMLPCLLPYVLYTR